MKVRFRTNLDEAKRCEWPEMNTPPFVGDIVRAVDSFGKGMYIEMEVARRTFMQETLYADETGSMPYTVCECELGLVTSRFKSISDFEKWVRKVRDGV